MAKYLPLSDVENLDRLAELLAEEETVRLIEQLMEGTIDESDASQAASPEEGDSPRHDSQTSD